jgi:uncharacterized protein (TIGR00369 family)
VTQESDRQYTHTAKGCYGCGEDNEHGLRLRPYHDGEWIVAEYTAEKRHRGFSRVVHGGVIAALLDEILTCASSIAMDELAATVGLEVEFKAPMIIGERYLIRARHLGGKEGRHSSEGEITSESGKVIARGRGHFIMLTPERAKKFL